MIDIKMLRADQEGQGMVEYGLIIGLIAIIVIAVFVALGGPLREMFANAVSDTTVGETQAELSSGIYPSS
ncbi:MAG: Flp family type IVb pilin [Candidatus Lindowbacteria bacterium]|nr:Flp family type IVb pilin [Candidatus Lindowbacteria bacterium]